VLNDCQHERMQRETRCTSKTKRPAQVSKPYEYSEFNVRSERGRAGECEKKAEKKMRQVDDGQMTRIVLSKGAGDTRYI